MDGTIGEVKIFAGNFAPRNWAICDGQLLSVSEYQALFSILGTIYGGDGRTSFGLPDLRGRAPVGAGQGPSLSNVNLGEKNGAESVTLTEAEMPSHKHTVNASTAVGTAGTPASGHWASHDEDVKAYHSSHDTTMAAESVQTAGGGQAHENRSPALGVNYIICYIGSYPSRN